VFNCVAEKLLYGDLAYFLILLSSLIAVGTEGI